MIISIEFDDMPTGGVIEDWFTGHEWLEPGATFRDRINATFPNHDEAMTWLRRNYRGADQDGVGIDVDSAPLTQDDRA
jgi:hypothetical protein